MSEIKVGDRCKVSGWGKIIEPVFNDKFYWFDDEACCDDEEFIGVIYRIDLTRNAVLVKFDERDCKLAEFHRKQCRKLVKVRKCDECDGLGWFHLFLKDCKLPYERRSCEKCNGSGKVKI